MSLANNAIKLCSSPATSNLIHLEWIGVRIVSSIETDQRIFLVIGTSGLAKN
jgi:hypothetical protein